MRKKVGLILLSIVMSAELIISARAVTVSDAKKEKEKTQTSLNNMESQVTTIENEKAEASEKLNQLQNQLVDILTSITICEDEIETKKVQIDSARDELLLATQQEADQYSNMKKRIKFMYEQGDKAYMQLLLESSGYTEMVNKADYVEKLYAYDKQLLADYVNSKEQVEELKETLENEEADLESANRELEEEQTALETLVAEQKATVDDFDSQLTNAKAKVAEYKDKLEQQTKQLQSLEKEEEQRKQYEAQLKKQQALLEKQRLEKQQQKQNDGDDSDSSDETDTSEDETIDTSDGNDDSAGFSAGAGDSIDVPTGSGLGQQVVNYACQFVGNPYVYGGTSLTNGTDCSGFTMSVYAHFGISIPRDSTSQRSCGVGVSLAEAQPGDIICYAGHVALYMGRGMIVHASTGRTGITYSPATYRTILAVRRVIN